MGNCALTRVMLQRSLAVSGFDLICGRCFVQAEDFVGVYNWLLIDFSI